MTFIYIMGGIILAGLAASYALLRKGGVWNPQDPFDEIDLTPTTMPSQSPETPPQSVSANTDMLDTFCSAIRDYEGKPGDLNYQLNNPGDCRPSPVGYLPKYQPVFIIDTDTNPEYPFHKGKFAKFPSYAIGYEYLENLVHFIATTHPTWTILQFFESYSPTGDSNSPINYATFVATRCGKTVNTTMTELLG